MPSNNNKSQRFEVQTAVKTELLRRNQVSTAEKQDRNNKIKDDLCDIFRNTATHTISSEEAVALLKEYFNGT